MKSEIFSEISNLGMDPGWILIGAAAVALISVIIAIISLCKLKKINRNYQEFMKGKDGKSLEDQVLHYFEKVEYLEEQEKNLRLDLKSVKESLKTTYQKAGLVRYDAFREMSGALSFSLALLDQENNGVLINSMYSREGCYAYAKSIKNGTCDINLSEEEQEALKQAMENGKSMIQ